MVFLPVCLRSKGKVRTVALAGYRHAEQAGYRDFFRENNQLTSSFCLRRFLFKASKSGPNLNDSLTHPSPNLEKRA